MSIHDPVTGICADLIRRRLVPKDELFELDTDHAVREEVVARLAAVGMVLLDRPGIPYFGVAMAGVYREAERATDFGLDSRALGLLLHMWLRLVAPFLYEGRPMPENPFEETVALESFAEELPGHWTASTLSGYLTRLDRLDWIKKVRGQDRVCAGPMLWLAIDHDRLMTHLREERGLSKAVERFLREKRGEGEI
jgi:hypothetical protein